MKHEGGMLAERRCVLKWHLLSLSFSECPYPTPPTYPHTHSHQLLHTFTHTHCVLLSVLVSSMVCSVNGHASWKNMTQFNRILSKGRQMALTEAKLSFAQACMEVLYKVFWADPPCMQTQTNFYGDCYHIYLAGFYALNQHVQWKTVLEKKVSRSYMQTAAFRMRRRSLIFRLTLCLLCHYHHFYCNHCCSAGTET